jgi:hypothetical protein
MTIVFRYHEADFVSAHWVYLLRHRFRFIYAFRLPLCMVAIGAIVIIEYPGSWQSLARLIVIGTGMLAFVLYGYWRNWIRRFSVEGFSHQIVTAEVDPAGLKTRVQTREAFYPWTAFSDIAESRRVFVFSRPDATFILLPKSEMALAQLEELRNLIASNAKGRVKLKPPPRP